VPANVAVSKMRSNVARATAIVFYSGIFTSVWRAFRSRGLRDPRRGAKYLPSAAIFKCASRVITSAAEIRLCRVRTCACVRVFTSIDVERKSDTS